MILYKYREPVNFEKIGECYTAKILSDNSLFYSKASNFNDPFDGQIVFDLTSSKEEAIDRHFRVLRTNSRSRKQFDHIRRTHDVARENVNRIYDAVVAGNYIDNERYYRDAMDDYGVLSLSEEPDNLLLWAHYAKDHNGICLGFDWDETGLPPAREMIYQSRYRKVDYWSHTEKELAEIALMQKSVDWAYEKEWRSISSAIFEWYSSYEPTEEIEKELKDLIKIYGENSETIRMHRSKHARIYKRATKPGSGAAQFRKNSLKEVIFGLRMTTETINKYIRYIESLGYTPTYKRATKHKERYAIDIVALNFNRNKRNDV